MPLGSGGRSSGPTMGFGKTASSVPRTANSAWRMVNRGAAAAQSTIRYSLTALLGRDHDRVALGRKGHPHPAGPGEQAGIERLNRVGIDRAALRPAFEQGCQSLGNTRIEARRGDAKAHALPFPG